MDSNRPTKPETPPPPDEAWRRFTLLDLLILFSGHEAALGLMKWYGWMDVKSYSGILEILSTIFVFFLLGGSIGIPFVLLVQFWSRRRRANFSDGEIHAVVAIVYWLLFCSVVCFTKNPIPLLLLFVVSLTTLIIFTTVMYLSAANLCTRKKTFHCFWLHSYGYFMSWVSSYVFIYWWIRFLLGYSQIV
jgi:hypothetical protein